MGIIRIDAAVRNPAELDRVWEGKFLVDTGAINCVVPRQHLESIGIAPKAQQTYRMADGTRVRMDIAVAEIVLMGELAGCTIVFADEGAEPLLGVTALEAVGIEIDPQNQKLTKLPATLLTGFEESE